MQPIRVRGAFALALLAALMLVPPSVAQTTLDMPVGEIRPYVADSGVRRNPADGPAVVFRDVVHVNGAAWLRVYFDHDTVLAPDSFIRITSLLDAESQDLDASALNAWDHSSAYFNGGMLLVELVAAAKSSGDRLVIDAVALESGVHHPGGLCGICGADDRVPSSVDWAGRLLPAGCTASVYNEDGCLVSAGHCITGGEVIQFRVPASNPDCSLNHPPVADQFPVTARLFDNNGVGNDWSVMTTGLNNVGESMFERFGLSRPIAFGPPSVGHLLDVWGYGVDTECTRSQA